LRRHACRPARASAPRTRHSPIPAVAAAKTCKGDGAYAGGPPYPLHALLAPQPQQAHDPQQQQGQQPPLLPPQQPLPGYQPGRALTERQLTTAIGACRTVEQLRAIVLPPGPHLNGIHACCALSQLAAIATRPPPFGGAASNPAAAAGAGQQRRLAQKAAAELAPKLTQLLPLLRPREVSTILYSWWAACQEEKGASYCRTGPPACSFRCCLAFTCRHVTSPKTPRRAGAASATPGTTTSWPPACGASPTPPT
jgi:hypothetical protein